MKLDSRTVALTPCSDYGAFELDESLDRVMAAAPPSINLCSATVLLKPNLITAAHGSLPCTEPLFILAAGRWFLDQGARVRIGDSPAFGSATAALHKLGLDLELQRLGIEITDFRSLRVMQLADGGRAGVAVDAVDCDLLVNLPRVKAHAQTRVTLAVKNCFGCLVGLRKPWWHMAHGGRQGNFARRLVLLLDLLADSLTLVDGITAMAQTGPVHGTPFPLGVVGASTNPVAMDRALHAVIDLDPEQSPLMQTCRTLRVHGACLSELDFPLGNPLELQNKSFAVPETLNPIRFSLLNFFRSSLKRIFLARERG